MEKILNLLKDNQALRTLDTDNGTIILELAQNDDTDTVLSVISHCWFFLA